MTEHLQIGLTTSIYSRQSTDAADAARAAMIQALRLTKDTQASTFTFGTVECAVCGEHVALKPDCDYDLTKWEDHKSKCAQCVAFFLFARFCDRSSANHIMYRSLSDPDGDVFSVRPPPSSRSESPVPSEAEAVVRIGKRRRDGDGDDDNDDEPPRSRARKEGTEGDGAGALGWILHPFRMFVRGFREGMQGSSSS